MVPSGRQVIQSYRGGVFRISDIEYRGPVLVRPERTVAWPVVDVARLVLDDFSLLLDADSAALIVILGCGERMQLPSPALRQGLKARGVIVEPMDTGAACRTFNVLMGEDRRAAAALLPTP